MRVPQSFLEGLIMFLLLIPIALFYILKWLIKGIVVLIATMKN